MADFPKPITWDDLTEEQKIQFSGPEAIIGENPVHGYPNNTPEPAAPVELPSEEPAPLPDQQAEPSSLDNIMKLLKPQSAAPMNINVGQGRNNPAELDKALAAQRNAQLTGNLGKAGELIGSGLSGAIGGGYLKPTTPHGTDLFNDIEKSGDTALKQYQIKKEGEKDDPNSPISKAFRDYSKKLGVNIQGDFTAAMGEKLLPMIFKGYEADANRQARHEDLAFKQQILKQNANDKASHKEEENLVKERKRFDDLMEKPNSARSGALGQAAQVIRRSEALDALTSGNQVTNTQLAEVGAGVASFVTGGGIPAASTINKFISDDIKSNYGRAMEWFTSNPYAQDRQALLTLYRSMTARERDVAQKQLNEYRARVIQNEKFPLLTKNKELEGNVDRYPGLKETMEPKTKEKSDKQSVTREQLAEYSKVHKKSLEESRKWLESQGLHVL